MIERIWKMSNKVPHQSDVGYNTNGKCRRKSHVAMKVKCDEAESAFFNVTNDGARCQKAADEKEGVDWGVERSDGFAEETLFERLVVIRFAEWVHGSMKERVECDDCQHRENPNAVQAWYVIFWHCE